MKLPKIEMSDIMRDDLIQQWLAYREFYGPVPLEKNPSAQDYLHSLPMDLGDVANDSEELKAWRNLTKNILDQYCPVGEDAEDQHFYMEQYGEREPSFSFALDLRTLVESSVDVAKEWSHFYINIFLPWLEDNHEDEYAHEMFIPFLRKLGFKVGYEGERDPWFIQSANTDSAYSSHLMALIFDIMESPDWARDTGLDESQLTLLAFTDYASNAFEDMVFYTSADEYLSDFSRGTVYCNGCDHHWDTENGGYRFDSYSYPLRNLQMNDLPALFLNQQLLSLGFWFRWLPLFLSWLFFYRMGKIPNSGYTVEPQTYAQMVARLDAAYIKIGKSGSLKHRLRIDLDAAVFIGKQVYLPRAFSYLPTRFKGWMARQRFRIWGSIDSFMQGDAFRWPFIMLFSKLPYRFFGRERWQKMPKWYFRIFSFRSTPSKWNIWGLMGIYQLERFLINSLFKLLNRTRLTDLWQRYVWVHLVRGERKEQLLVGLQQRRYQSLEYGKDWTWYFNEREPGRGVIIEVEGDTPHYHEWVKRDPKSYNEEGFEYTRENGEVVHFTLYKTNIMQPPNIPNYTPMYGSAYYLKNTLVPRELKLIHEGPIQRFVRWRWGVSQSGLLVIGDPIDDGEHEALVRCPYCGHKHMEAGR